MICEYCGAEFNGRKRKYCSNECCYNADKDRKRLEYVWKGDRADACVICGKPLPKQSKKYCSVECRRGKVQKKKTCIVCGAEFTTTRSKKLTCSEECCSVNAREKKNAAFIRRYRKANPDARTMEEVLTESAKRKERLKQEREVIETAKQAERQKILAEREKIKAANIAYWQEYENTHICSVCGKEYTAHSPKSKYCSKACSRKPKRRRDRYKGITVDNDITLEKLARKDGDVCQICGGVVNWDDREEKNGVIICGNYYPSIDHIKPISKGGLHSWNNVQLAHRICNTLKCDKVI